MWSVAAADVPRLGSHVPPAAAAEAEACARAGKLPGAAALGGLEVRIADASVVCEAVDSGEWAPRELWAATPAKDGYPDDGCGRRRARARV